MILDASELDKRMKNILSFFDKNLQHTHQVTLKNILSFFDKNLQHTHQVTLVCCAIVVNVECTIFDIYKKRDLKHYRVLQNETEPKVSWKNPNKN